MGLQGASARRQSLAALVAACLVGSCRGAGVLDPQGPVASAERLILLNATAIMLVVVVPVIILTLAFAWWFRASNRRATYSPDWSHSGHIELVVWSIPAMVVILLAGVAWTSSQLLDPPRALKSDVAPIRIEVVSLDWKWLFIYPDQHVAAVNDLVVPAGTPVEFMLTSATVMNSFFVPQLGGQIYTMPGMTTRLNQRNGITTAPAATQLPHLHKQDPTSVDSLTWSSGDHTPIAVLYTVHGGGHVVPQPAFRYPRMLGRTAGDLDAPSSALQFFGLSQ
jgi:cytochrome o ubiquinol oxidase subunit II